MSDKPPAPPRQPLTPKEAWYRECLIQWTKAKKKPPTMDQLAAWLGKSPTAIYSALISCEHKGHVGRYGKTRKQLDRRMVAI